MAIAQTVITITASFSACLLIVWAIMAFFMRMFMEKFEYAPVHIGWVLGPFFAACSIVYALAGGFI
jgi:hypothetical protein